MTRRTTTVAVLGTGVMGAAMARSPLRAGLDVAAWNRTPSRAEPPAADGARTAASAAEAADGADVVVTMVHDASAALDAVRAAAPGPRPGAVRLQTATVGPGDLPRPTASAREHGLVHVDAPVPRTRAPASPPRTGSWRRRPPVPGRGDAAEAGPQPLGPHRHPRRRRGARPRERAGRRSAGLPGRGRRRPARHGLPAGQGRPPPLRRVGPGLDVRTAGKDARLIVAAGEAAAGAGRLRRAAGRGHGDEDMAASYHASLDGPDGGSPQG